MRSSDAGARALTYLEHLTERDLDLLATTAGEPDPARLRRDPDRLEAALAHPELHAALFDPPPVGSDPLLRVSPFLVFAAAVHAAAQELHRLAYVQEWAGPRQRLPVFVDDDLRSFLDDADHRLFITELLASYTHVASGVVWVRTPRGPRRRRYSELDPARLASLLEVLPEEAHPGVFRRLGDLALFLTGVFPDHTAARSFAPIDVHRLARAVDASTDIGDRLVDALAGRGAVGLLEELGARWYRLAARTAEERFGATIPVAETVADRFPSARRVLNHLTDRSLFPFRTRWFPSAS